VAESVSDVFAVSVEALRASSEPPAAAREMAPAVAVTGVAVRETAPPAEPRTERPADSADERAASVAPAETTTSPVVAVSVVPVRPIASPAVRVSVPVAVASVFWAPAPPAAARARCPCRRRGRSRSA
jgi:hypothetical protein